MSTMFGTKRFKVGDVSNQYSTDIITNALDESKIGQDQRADQYNQAQQARDQQMTLANALEAQMRGEGPTLAQQQLTQGRNQNIASQAGQAATNRSVNPALAARLQAQTTAQSNQTAAADAAALRAAESQAAQTAFGTNASNIRTQDQAGVAQEGGYALAQQDAASAQSEADRQANLEKERIQAGYNQASSDARGKLTQNVGTAVAAMFSDENSKETPKDGTSKLRKFVDSFTKTSNSDPKKQDSNDPNWMGTLVNNVKSSDSSAASSGASTEGLAGMLGSLMASEGGVVPGKAEVKGDSEKNDTITAKLSPGELIVPRTIVDEEDEVILDWINAMKKKSSKDSEIKFTPKQDK